MKRVSFRQGSLTQPNSRCLASTFARKMHLQTWQLTPSRAVPDSGAVKCLASCNQEADAEAMDVETCPDAPEVRDPPGREKAFLQCSLWHVLDA